MPKRKIVPFEREPVKTCWHPYSLQELQADRFIRAVAGIIAGQMTLVPFAEERSVMR